MRAWARQHAARGRGVSVGAGSRCTCCGSSPFGPAERPRSEILSESFSDHEWLLDPSAPDVCVGCAALLAGRPGDDPPPFRMIHVLVTERGTTLLPRPADVAAVLLSPPAESFALVWSIARKRHAWLRAERCDAARIVVGTDDGPVVYEPATDRPLLGAVAELLGAFGRGSVARGDYSAAAIPRVGVSWWSARESIVARRRPSALLSMLCAILPRSEAPPAPLGEPVIDPTDEDAVHLLASIARGSALRSRDGLAFWRGTFRHRVQRFARLPLPDLMSRLIAELRVESHSDGAAFVGEALRSWSAERQSACARPLRARGPFLVPLSYDVVQRAKIAHMEIT